MFRAYSSRRTVFVGVALCLLAAELVTLQLPLFERRPAFFTTTVLLDLSLVAPLALFFLVRLWRPLNWTVLYSFACLGVLAASLITGTKLLPLVVLLQLSALFIWLRRLGKFAGDVADSRRQGADWLESFQATISSRLQALISHPLFKLSSLDVKVWRYSVFGYVKPKYENALAIFSYSKSVTPYLHCALAFILVLEVIPQHILIHQWNPLSAWALSILTLYGLLWLWADYRSLSLKPNELHPDSLKLHYGIRASAEIPLDAVLSIAPFDPETDEDAVSLSVKKEPSLTITLCEEVTVHKLFGSSPSKKLAVSLDDDEAFIEKVLEQRNKD